MYKCIHHVHVHVQHVQVLLAPFPVVICMYMSMKSVACSLDCVACVKCMDCILWLITMTEGCYAHVQWLMKEIE